MKTTIQRTRYHAIATPAHVGAPAAKLEYCFPSHDMVARRAYEIWQRHGCPEGTEFHDWLAAEAELRSCR
jgi:hypothetical protein